MRRVDLHDPHSQLLLVVRARLPAGLGADPAVEAAPIRDQYPAQPFHAEPTAQSVDDRKPLPRGSAVDQRLGRLAQNLVLDPKMLNLTAVTANLVTQLPDDGFEILTAGAAAFRHNRELCRMPIDTRHEVAESCLSEPLTPTSRTPDRIRQPPYTSKVRSKACGLQPRPHPATAPHLEDQQGSAAVVPDSGRVANRRAVAHVNGGVKQGGVK